MNYIACNYSQMIEKHASLMLKVIDQVIFTSDVSRQPEIRSVIVIGERLFDERTNTSIHKMILFYFVLLRFCLSLISCWSYENPRSIPSSQSSPLSLSLVYTTETGKWEVRLVKPLLVMGRRSFKFSPDTNALQSFDSLDLTSASSFVRHREKVT